MRDHGPTLHCGREGLCFRNHHKDVEFYQGGRLTAKLVALSSYTPRWCTARQCGEKGLFRGTDMCSVLEEGLTRLSLVLFGEPEPLRAWACPSTLLVMKTVQRNQL